MFHLIKQFFTDPVYFRQQMASLRFGNRLRGLIASAGMLLMADVVPLDYLSEQLGHVGWWAGRILLVMAFFIRSGDSTMDVLSNLSEEQVKQLKGLLEKVRA